MLVVGPAILNLADPTNEHVSVFTQTMDQILSGPLAILGTLVGIAVLLSAAAASAQGLQFLFLGLKYRHCLPSVFGQRNKFEVADKPVWLEVGLVSITFLAFGTNEETYLAIYAAWVFILLSMTGWAAAKLLGHELRAEFVASRLAALVGTIQAAMLTSGATVLIFTERFFDGAWTYLIFLPILYALFSFFRQRLGDPPQIEERLGREIFGRYLYPTETKAIEPTKDVAIKKVLVPLDGSDTSEQILPYVRALGKQFDSEVLLLSALDAPGAEEYKDNIEGYLDNVVSDLEKASLAARSIVTGAEPAETILAVSESEAVDLIMIAKHSRGGLDRFMLGSVADRVVQQTKVPVFLVPVVAR